MNSMNLIQRVLAASLLVASVIVFEARGQSSNSAPPQPTPIAADLQRAAGLAQSGKLDEAESIVRNIIKTVPNNSDAHNLLGIILDQRGQTEQAEREYRTAIKLNSRAISARTNLGVLLGRSNRTEEAIKTFEAVLQLFPDHPQATLNLGLQYAAIGSDDRAIPLLQRAIALGLDNDSVRYRLGVSLFNLKRFDEATASFETAVKLRQHFPAAYFMLGEALRSDHRITASIDYYKHALEQDPTQFVYYARLGGVYITLGQTSPALEVFRSAVQRFPSIPQAHYFMGIAARANADYELAETEFRKSLELEQNNVNALAQLGFILFERNHVSEGESTLRRAIAINDKHFYANYDLGRLLVKSRRYDEAIPILQRAAAIKPNNPSAHYQMFIALSRLKRKDEADRELALFKELEEARKRRPRTEGDTDDDDAQNPSSSVPQQ